MIKIVTTQLQAASVWTTSTDKLNSNIYYVSFRIDLQILHQTVRKTPDKLIKIETGEPK